jgi:hypothetical protein
MPARMIVEMVSYSSVFWLNSFPALDGISHTLSPRAIIIGSNVMDNKHCRLELGTYVQTHKEHDNTMLPRTIGAIALRPTGNAQGGIFSSVFRQDDSFTAIVGPNCPCLPTSSTEFMRQLPRRSGADLRGLEFVDRRGDNIIINDADSTDGDDDDSSYATEI